MKIWSLLRRVPLMFYIAGALIFEMVFIDENSFVQNIRYDRQISQLRKSVNHYQQIVDESRARLDELRSDDENLEKFARETYQKKSTGFYQLLEFDAEPSVIEKLEVNFRRDERVIRFLTFKMDKFAAEYAAKRRNVKSAKEEKEN